MCVCVFASVCAIVSKRERGRGKDGKEMFSLTTHSIHYGKGSLREPESKPTAATSWPTH